MVHQIVFIGLLIVSLVFFSFTAHRLISFFRLTRSGFRVPDFPARFLLMMKVAFGQTKIFRKPLVGLMHALVFWGFCVILLGSVEMILDGVFGLDKSLSFLGPVYNVIMASGDLFGLIVGLIIIAFLIRRIFLHIRRFHGIEMKSISHLDANVALTLILLLMISLLGMNAGYLANADLEGDPIYGVYPVSYFLAGFISPMPPSTQQAIYYTCWWTHIVLIFIFANLLPYSKHFHVFLSVPNVFLSRLEPLGKLENMDSVMREVKLMMDPSALPAEPDAAQVGRFGVKDAEDVTWKNYFDSLSCTECGRCTDVCPANITGKRLSPRKIMMDLRARMKEKGPGMVRHGKTWSDSKSLIRDYIREEEIWACTTCNACAMECPVNINHPSLIVDMRRYLVMEEASAPGALKGVFNNIENNGAPWQYSSDDRLIWARDLDVPVPVMADLQARGHQPEYLFWVGCAGAYDDRYKKVARSFTRILSHLNTDYAVLGKEETCTGDPARRSGNEMLFQMQALQNINIFEQYGVKKILTICPHCYNTFHNEYPDLGGHYQVVHYTQFLAEKIEDGSFHAGNSSLKDTAITFHDPCYLGRANQIYDAPRKVIRSVTADFREMRRNRSFALCCGAGGAQMFKEAEKGDKEVFLERTSEALQTDSEIIATSCPFCMTMMTDGIKYNNMEARVRNLDIAELVEQSI